MKKKNTDIERSKTIKALALTFLVFVSLCGLIYLFFVWIAYESHFYDEYEIVGICELMKISSTDFCDQSKRVKSEDLEQALEITYPPELTTYDDIIKTVDGTVYLAWRGGESCRDLTADRRNMCPEPSRCTSDYVCYVDSSATTIYLGFNSEGQLQWLSVPQKGS